MIGSQARVHRSRLATVLAATTVLLLGSVVATTATASAAPSSAGTISLAFGGPAWAQLGKSGCGTPAPVASQDVQVVTTGHELRVNFPVASFGADVYSNSDSYIVLVNNCWGFEFGPLDITSFGQPGQSVVLAFASDPNGGGVGPIATLNLATEVLSYSPSGTKARIEKLGLLLTDESAYEMNVLLCGSSCNVFYTGEQIGNAKITLTGLTPTG